MSRRIFFLLLIAVLIVVPMYARTILEARAHLDEGNALLALAPADAANLPTAIEEFRRAVSWDSPLNPFSRRAINELKNIAFDGSNQPGQIRITALRALLRGLRTSRNFLEPRSLGGSDELMVRIKSELTSLTATEQEGLVRPYQEPDTHFPFQILAQVSFWLWMLCAFWTIFRGFTPEGRLQIRKFGPGSTAIAIFYVVWLLALSRA
jgi:hypothetical protein